MAEVRLTGRLICRSDQEVAAVRAALPRHVRVTRAEPGCLAFDIEAHQARIRASDWSRLTAHIRRDFEVA